MSTYFFLNVVVVIVGSYSSENNSTRVALEIKFAEIIVKGIRRKKYFSL